MWVLLQLPVMFLFETHCRACMMLLKGFRVNRRTNALGARGYLLSFRESALRWQPLLCEFVKKKIQELRKSDSVTSVV